MTRYGTNYWLYCINLNWTKMPLHIYAHFQVFDPKSWTRNSNNQLLVYWDSIYYGWILEGRQHRTKMHTWTLCTSSIACESFWSASRMRSVSLWMMTSSGPCSSRGWLRSSWREDSHGSRSVSQKRKALRQSFTASCNGLLKKYNYVTAAAQSCL